MNFRCLIVSTWYFILLFFIICVLVQYLDHCYVHAVFISFFNSIYLFIHLFIFRKVQVAGDLVLLLLVITSIISY